MRVQMTVHIRAGKRRPENRVSYRLFDSRVPETPPPPSISPMRPRQHDEE